ncbi:hypothetical protein OSB04_028368 [Centaurea solstitialis]|uniref:non-specific serine/threonine protein kinase n=1 Tax=Centaurea solstitialis TaxID=347529 RepID=A0AA38W0J8_9ASTR|nr:hypothetical protein OSB04_028368 [Centaurea solstitialis]
MRGSLISLLRILAVIPAAFGTLPVLPPPSTTSVPDQLQLPPPLPTKINSTPKQDAILVAAPDGTLYQVDISSGKILWSFPSGAPIYDSHQEHNLEDDEHNSSKQHNKFYIDCGDDWQLYIHGKNSKAEKLPIGAEELIGRTPLVSVDGVLVGSKKTTVFLVDSQTGSVVYTFKSDGGQSLKPNSIILKKDAEKWKEPTTLDFDPVDHEQLLYIKRFDYELTYSSSTTGNVLWHLMFADFEASRQCRGSNNFLGGIKGDAELQEFCQSNPPYSEPVIPANWKDDASFLYAPNLLPKPLIVDRETPYQLVPYLPPDNTINEHRTNLSIPPENPGSIHVWLRGLVAAPFFFIPLILYFWNFVRRKRDKINELGNDIKVQNVTSKKKKTRKSGNGRLYVNTEKKVNELQYSEVTETSNNRRIGKLLVSEKEIGKGSNGTIVLEGIYDARPVAVKRIVKVHHDVALKEIQNLIVSDQHPNIVRWYDDNESSLGFQIVEAQWASFTVLLKVMRDTVTGLAHLHELGIIHRDLKPQNVLIRKDNSISAKVSDMGISKRLPADMTSLTKSATGKSSLQISVISGWQAPEQLRNERQTRAVDLFSFGCLLFFCITGGRHPFGDMLERDINIVNDRKDLFLVDNIPEAFDLISNLLHPDPEFRPKAGEVYNHPLFWDSEMRLSFLRDASDRVELEDREADSDLLKSLESIGTVALGGKWDEKLDNTLLNDIGRYRKYKYDSVRDLLRVIRNKLNHYRELPKELRDVLGPVPTGFEYYFSSRFPKLLMEVYKVLHKYCGKEEFLHKYYKEGQF